MGEWMRRVAADADADAVVHGIRIGKFLGY